MLRDEFKKFVKPFVGHIALYSTHSIKSGAISNPACRSVSADLLQPRTKPVETSRENAYFFLSSWQKLKPPPNECPISPLPLSKVV